jgi:predicted anti-sigma-YlaC factor YlaD
MRSVKADCDRARAWLSADLDCELSAFESTLLHAHLSGCASCRGFGADVDAFTEMLRSAPLEESDLRVVMPQRRRWLPVQSLRATVAALAVAAVGLGSVFASIEGSGVFNNATPSAAAADVGQFRELQAFKRAAAVDLLRRRAAHSQQMPAIRRNSGRQII